MSYIIVRSSLIHLLMFKYVIINQKSITIVWNQHILISYNNLLYLLISDLDQPTFNTTLPNTVSVIEGRYFSVACNATSNPIAKYRWTTSSGNIISNTSDLVFGNINRTDATTYTCEATNGAGLKKSSTLTIDVQCEYAVF